MKVAICGMSGVGKGEAIKRLTALLDAEGICNKVYKEDTNKQLYEVAIKDKNKMYLNQLGRFLNMYTRDVLAYEESDEYKVQIFDRSIQEADFYSSKFLTSSQHRKLRLQMDHIYRHSNFDSDYDLIVLLTASTTTILQRLKDRGRDNLDPKMVKKYIDINERYYGKWRYTKLDAKDYFFIDDACYQKLDEQLPKVVEQIKDML